MGFLSKNVNYVKYIQMQKSKIKYLFKNHFDTVLLTTISMTQSHFKTLDKSSYVRLNSKELHFETDFIEILSQKQIKALNSNLVIDQQQYVALFFNAALHHMDIQSFKRIYLLLPANCQGQELVLHQYFESQKIAVETVDVSYLMRLRACKFGHLNNLFIYLARDSVSYEYFSDNILQQRQTLFFGSIKDSCVQLFQLPFMFQTEATQNIFQDYCNQFGALVDSYLCGLLEKQFYIDISELKYFNTQIVYSQFEKYLLNAEEVEESSSLLIETRLLHNCFQQLHFVIKQYIQQILTAIDENFVQINQIFISQSYYKILSCTIKETIHEFLNQSGEHCYENYVFTTVSDLDLFVQFVKEFKVECEVHDEIVEE